ncbi:hypothetical protein [Cerasicoccus arenae]|uniref:Uncharacterized protein n=1 Tax=Cerasicoccus arenae TaxID=424488 RepID=A0A8J3GCW4_9BACT|nr:hypothetical protein [Cerasicoccus arenae]MBK1858211.1 hypothetical protein [Cerasicoccus arenae]GHC01933.1 hypothetical protein GCM10007047_17990 [Cerasicoccus arenae]
MQDTIERTTISLEGPLYAAAKGYGRQRNLKFSQVVAEALEVRLRAEGYLPNSQEESNDLTLCRELRQQGIDPQPALTQLMEERILSA